MLTKGATRLCVLAAAVAGWSCPAASEPRSLSCYLAALERYAQADYPAVLAQTAAAVEDDPRMWQAWQLAGNARLALGDLRGAMTDYRRALDLHPDNPVLAET